MSSDKKEEEGPIALPWALRADPEVLRVMVAIVSLALLGLAVAATMPPHG